MDRLKSRQISSSKNANIITYYAADCSGTKSTPLVKYKFNSY